MGENVTLNDLIFVIVRMINNVIVFLDRTVIELKRDL